MKSKKHDLSSEAGRHTAVYARDSAIQQKKSTLEAQVSTCARQAVEDVVPPVVAAYVFRDRQSGSGLDRPGLTHLRQAVQAGEVGLVYVSSSERLSCVPEHRVLLYEEFAAAGVEIRFVQGSFDDHRRSRLSGLVASGVSGYAHDKAEVPTALDERQAGTMRLVLELACDGWSADDIAAYLSEREPLTERGG
ncbi:MAG: recombinase family protein [Chloroflexi bacterium]|nr:recombinase family protein [Chloroflexota bacterium]